MDNRSHTIKMWLASRTVFSFFHLRLMFVLVLDGPFSWKPILCWMAFTSITEGAEDFPMPGKPSNANRCNCLVFLSCAVDVCGTYRVMLRISFSISHGIYFILGYFICQTAFKSCSFQGICLAARGYKIV